MYLGNNARNWYEEEGEILHLSDVHVGYLHQLSFLSSLELENVSVDSLEILLGQIGSRLNSLILTNIIMDLVKVMELVPMATSIIFRNTKVVISDFEDDSTPLPWSLPPATLSTR